MSGVPVRYRMRHPVTTVGPRDKLDHAREVMARLRINQLPVVVSNSVVGLLSDRDVRDACPSVFESADRPLEAAETTENVLVEQVMSANVLSVTPDTDLADAAATMQSERIGALPVVENDRLVGILTRSDVLAAFVALHGR